MSHRKQFNKGDIVAIITTTVAHYADHRPATKSHAIRLVRVESATRDGVGVTKYAAYPGSPSYKYDNPYGRHSLRVIGGDNQAKARKLWDAAKYFLDYADQDEVKNAILGA